MAKLKQWLRTLFQEEETKIEPQKSSYPGNILPKEMVINHFEKKA